MRKEDFVSLGVSEEAAEKAAEAYEKAVFAVKLAAAVDSALVKAGVKNVKAVKALLSLDGAVLSEDGGVKGLEEQIDALKTAEDSEFMFVSERRSPIRITGAVTGETGREIPDNRADFSKMSYSELCAFMEKNPKAKI